MATCRSKRTHCSHGHELAVVGTYTAKTKTRGGKSYVSTLCQECKRESSRRQGAAARLRRSGGEHVPMAIAEASRVERIMNLIDAKWLASTTHDRDAIQLEILRLEKLKDTA